MSYEDITSQFKNLVDTAHKIVILQADNPDGDSLASSLALEQILGEYGKEVHMYCAIDMPDHLKHLEGWDRVSKEFPSSFDLAVLVDCGFWRLLGHLEEKHSRGVLPKEKLIIIDHHDTPHDMEAVLDCNDIDAVSTGQAIYEITLEAGLSIDKTAATFIAASILSDSLGFTSEAMYGKPRTFEIMADLVRRGIDLAQMQEKRLARLRITPDLLHYRGELLQRVEFYGDTRVAFIEIPYEEIKEHSQEFNPTVILDETRMVEGVAVTIGLKQYISQGSLVRVTGRIRCNRGFQIADKLAKTFGDDGGGHPYAAGFKLDGHDLNFADIKNKIIARAIELLDQ